MFLLDSRGIIVEEMKIELKNPNWNSYDLPIDVSTERIYETHKHCVNLKMKTYNGNRKHIELRHVKVVMERVEQCLFYSTVPPDWKREILQNWRCYMFELTTFFANSKLDCF